MTILKCHVKVFRFVRRKHSVAFSDLENKYGHDIICTLVDAGYLECVKDPRNIDPFDQKTREFPPSAKLSLTNEGMAAVEAHDWCDWEFLVKDFFVPIAVSVVTTLITLFLKGVL